MNLPNKLSVARVCLIPVLVALMYPTSLVWRLIAALVYGAAAITDMLDGRIARSRGLVTDFGKFIDPVADKLLNLSAMAMLAVKGILPAWVLILVLARELAVDGLRMVAVGQGRVIAAAKLGKLKTLSQCIMIPWMIVFPDPVFSGSVMGIISTVLAMWVAVITLWSGVEYFLKNKDCLSQVK